MSTVTPATDDPRDSFPPTADTTARVAERGTHDRAVVYAVFDETTFSHVGFTSNGRPMVMPMLHARIDDALYLHGSPSSRVFRAMSKGTEICVTATIMDGLVLARSAFHHSANYRSAVVMGRPEPVRDLDERREVLDVYTDKLVPGRRQTLRPMTEKEVRGTAVARLAFEEASAKVRTGPPVDEPDDLGFPVWVGVVPISTVFGDPITAPDCLPGIDVPDHVRSWL